MISEEIEVCFGSDNLSQLVPSLPNLFSVKDTALQTKIKLNFMKYTLLQGYCSKNNKQIKMNEIIFFYQGYSSAKHKIN